GVGLVGRGVGEGTGPVDDLDRPVAGELPARRGERREDRLAALRHVPGQTALQLDQPAEIGRLERVLHRPPDENDNRLVAELLVEARRRLRGRRAVPDERIRRRARLELKRQRDAHDRERGRHRDRRERPLRRRAGDAPEELPDGQDMLRLRTAYRSGATFTWAYLPPCPISCPFGDCSTHGGAGTLPLL